jgi:hypothetical protein
MLGNLHGLHVFWTEKNHHFYIIEVVRNRNVPQLPGKTHVSHFYMDSSTSNRKMLVKLNILCDSASPQRSTAFQKRRSKTLTSSQARPCYCTEFLIADNQASISGGNLCTLFLTSTVDIQRSLTFLKFPQHRHRLKRR